ncbi:hypothetical protein HDV00_003245 [Rhizophlyctis rosea]|nr:hypothetical protein HDV00_003245 [Rhizophlyctis rosea]
MPARNTAGAGGPMPEVFQPDHYFEPGGIPVFKPTMEQFKDFRRFMKAVEPFGHAAGIMKIIPPVEWKNTLPDITPRLRKVRIRKPIAQEITGGGLPAGAYTQMNLEQRKTYSGKGAQSHFGTNAFLSQYAVQDWYDRANSSEHAPPRFNDEGKVVSQPSPQLRKRDRKKQKPDATEHASQPTSNLFQSSSIPTPTSELAKASTTAQTPPPSRLTDQSESSSKAGTQTAGQDEGHFLEGPQVANGTSVAGKKRRRRDDHDEEESEVHFDLDQTSQGYTDNRCSELERFYWRNITYMSAMYGADMLGSLFEEQSQNPWNPAQLDNLLNRVDVKVPGVNVPYLYFGMWKATFAWHVEDMDLYSINYIHFGAPKQWYSIPPNQRGRFELVAGGLFADEAHRCPEFLRHKMSIISPKKLATYHVPVHRLIQRAGEFVVTFPYGYHQGYNLGFNCAESVNFALDSWVEVGKKAGFCRCVGDSVKLDVTAFFGEPSEDAEDEDVSVEIEDTPKKRKATTEKKSSAKRAKRIAEPVRRRMGGIVKKSPEKEKAAKKVKRRNVEKEEPKTAPDYGEEVHDTPAPRLRIRIQLPPVKCELCPSTETGGMLEVMELPEPNDAQVRPVSHQEPFAPNVPAHHTSNVTDQSAAVSEMLRSLENEEAHSHQVELNAHLVDQTGQPDSPSPAKMPTVTKWAHKLCALWIPETDVKQHPSDASKEVISGLNNVPKARWALKCDICKRAGVSKVQLKKGACIQCAKGKCVRAYHVTCAMEAGLLMMETDGVRECYCPKHDTRAEEHRRQEKADLLRKEAQGLSVGSIVLVKQHGTFYEGCVQEVMPDTGRLRVSFVDGPPQIVHMSAVKTAPTTREPSPSMDSEGMQREVGTPMVDQLGEVSLKGMGNLHTANVMQTEPAVSMEKPQGNVATHPTLIAGPSNPTESTGISKAIPTG